MRSEQTVTTVVGIRHHRCEYSWAAIHCRRWVPQLLKPWAPAIHFSSFTERQGGGGVTGVTWCPGHRVRHRDGQSPFPGHERECPRPFALPGPLVIAGTPWAPSAPAPWLSRSTRRTGFHRGHAGILAAPCLPASPPRLPPRRPNQELVAAPRVAVGVLPALAQCFRPEPGVPDHGLGQHLAYLLSRPEPPRRLYPGRPRGSRRTAPSFSVHTQWWQPTVRCVRSAACPTRPHNPGEHPTKGGGSPDIARSEG